MTDVVPCSRTTTTTGENYPTRSGADRFTDDKVEGIVLADLCTALETNGFPIKSVALAHNWAAFRLTVRAFLRYLPADVREKLTDS